MKQVFVNIPSYIEDSNYRYKMPKPQLKIEGKGNGIKTNLLNLNEIARALNCPDQYPLKFLGYELGSQTIYKSKNDNDVTCIINGSFKDEDIRKTLDKFIEKYILCQKCKYPEMYIKIEGKKFYGTCESCGHLSDLDNSHRLASYIFKNPPKNAHKIDNKLEVQQQQQFDVEAQVQKQEKKKKLKAADLPLHSEQLEEMVDQLTSIYNNITTQNQVDSVDATDMVLTQQIRNFNLDKTLLDRVCYLLFQCMFDKVPVEQLDKNYELLTTLLQQVDGEHYNTHVILNIQHLMRRQQIEDKYFATILKGFYDYSYIEDTFLIKWYDNSQEWNSEKLCDFLYNEELDNHYRELAKPMMEWLKQYLANAEQEEQE